MHVVLDERCLVKAYRYLIQHVYLADSIYKPSESVIKMRSEVYPLPLKHSETHRWRYCLECRLSDLQRNGHILQNSVLVPLHQLHRCKLLRLAAKHLIIERERRYNPLRRILSDSLDSFHDEVLDSVTADRLPEIVLTGKKLLCRRTDHSYRSNEVGCNRLIELIKICQSENVVEAAEEQRSAPALVEPVHRSHRVCTQMQKLIDRELYELLGESALQEHFWRCSEIYRIALHDRILDVRRHLVQICVLTCKLVEFELDIPRRVDHEPDLASELVAGDFVDHQECDLLVALRAYAFALSVPLKIYFRYHFIHGYHELTTFRTAQCPVDHRHRIYEHVAHCGKLLANAYQKLQQIVTVLEQLLGVLERICVRLRGGLFACYCYIGSEVSDDLVDSCTYDRKSVMHVLCPVEALLDGLWKEPVGPCAERVCK